MDKPKENEGTDANQEQEKETDKEKEGEQANEKTENESGESNDQETASDEMEAIDEIDDELAGIENKEIIEQNNGFIIFEPAQDVIVQDSNTIRGKTSALEGTVLYELEDGHFFIWRRNYRCNGWRDSVA